MTSNGSIQMPNFFIYIKTLIIGFLIGEAFYFGYFLGEPASAEFRRLLKNGVETGFRWLSSHIESFNLIAYSTYVSLALLILIPVLITLFVLIPYLKTRGTKKDLMLLVKSKRLDLLFTLLLGGLIQYKLLPQLEIVHVHINSLPYFVAITVLLFFLIIFYSSTRNVNTQNDAEQQTANTFVNDEPIEDEDYDFLDMNEQVKNFADQVISCSSSTSLVFGVDGPWGVGKSSLINMAERHWKESNNEGKLVICRFEPLRHASENNITQRLITEITTSIQKKVFAPELTSAASRYSRLVKGTANISLFGVKLSLSHTPESIDDLLEDIDSALKRLGLHIIIVIDDLDILDPKSVNNVLFATKQSFKLSQATYVLCYDTEVLIGDQDDKSKAREFLEKFITVKLNLLVDTKDLIKYLRYSWQSGESLELVPPDTKEKLSSVLTELADILESEHAAEYLPLVGSFRKLKRLVNTMILMQLESSSLAETDFNKRDLINLILLHLNYPGLFRRIYLEETCDTQGNFSVRKGDNGKSWQNSGQFNKIIEEQEHNAQFLLRHLFAVDTLKIKDSNDYRLNDEFRYSRACFNSGQFRNLEKFLKLIIRCVKPEPKETFILYKAAVDEVISGLMVSEVLESEDRINSIDAYDKFWTLLVSHSGKLDRTVVDDLIPTLISHIQNSSILFDTPNKLRQRLVLSLIHVLNQCGWGEDEKSRVRYSALDCKEIAWRIFGSNQYKNKGILQKFITNSQSILGWKDLMLFRLYCSADRGGQYFNLSAALIKDQNNDGETTGSVNLIATVEMRKISQEVFSLFKRNYIDESVNFFDEIAKVPEIEFSGKGVLKEEDNYTGSLEFSQRIAITRTYILRAVLHQLANSFPPTGSGVGCGFYDETGTEDKHGIAIKMNEYLFEVCFNPESKESNALHFIDYCLAHLTDSFFHNDSSNGPVAKKEELLGPLNPEQFKPFWKKHKGKIIEVAKQSTNQNRKVYTPNYIAIYSDDLTMVLNVLEEIAEEPNEQDRQETD
ncbi:P-loop NTPase fold protein [Pseudoalteromonas piscicida]|uniref:KAP NTPase domain-containing protein n=1 Tax=Pseudoalteromonas piscicida TaxID=43662 RepID=A0ABM6NG54_PSEO7|nr:P-loop NTPase fold protein [Pseudoalteromonas piscicida]ATD07944.1 hypothetical protein PPIS_a3093 [Pseudoalteromonas piscicida]WPU30025.1 P-loop NTPase fold protein [Pseudoalteromonas piscicida]